MNRAVVFAYSNVGDRCLRVLHAGGVDVALVVDAAVPAADVEAALRDGAGELLEGLRLFDVFTGARHETTRSLLSAAVGTQLPEWIRAALKPQPSIGDRILVRLIFFGDTAFKPLTGRLVAELGADVNILAGSIEEIAGEPYGSLVVAYPADPAVMQRANTFYASTGLATEVLGYVA